MIGLRGITEDRLAPSGYVRVHGELWQAEVVQNSPPIEKGESVRVHGCRATIKKVVEPKVTFTELKEFVKEDVGSEAN
jgi:membrane-bound ClpP family serine protease